MPVPGIGGIGDVFALLDLVTKLYRIVGNVKLYRQRCHDLCDECNRLLLALRESTEGMESSKALEAADEFSNIVTGFYEKMQLWASWNLAKSFISQGDIKQGIDTLSARIGMCATRFHISINIEIHRGQKEIMDRRERDHIEIKHALHELRREFEHFKRAVGQMPAGEAEILQQSMQQVLMPSDVPPQGEPGGRDIYSIMKNTRLDSPPPNLSLQLYPALSHDWSSGSIRPTRRFPEVNNVSGTLEDLVHHLITDSDHIKDLEFRSVFLGVYTAFTSGQELFSALKTRYTHAIPTSEMNVTVRYNVMLVMKQWFTSGLDEDNVDLLCNIKDFCHNIRTSPIMAELAKDVFSRVDDQLQTLRSVESPLRSLPSPTASIVSGFSQPESTLPVHIKELDMAVALTILEGQKFSSIGRADYIAYCKHGDNRGGAVSLAQATNNSIDIWVKRTILRQKAWEKRGMRIVFFLQTAEECRKLHNFSSMRAIINALHSDLITRLSLTRRAMKKEKGAERLFKSLSMFFDMAEGYRTYKAALKRSEKQCVPCLDVQLLDIKSVHSRIGGFDDGGRPIIHFEYCIQLQKLLEDIAEYHVPPVQQSRNDGHMAYLENQLSRSRTSPTVTDELEKRSIALEEQERREVPLENLRNTGTIPG